MPGEKSSKEELRKRIKTVTDWILGDNLTSDIIRSAVQLWEVSERQAQRYMFFARRFLVEKDNQSINQKKAIYLARKKKLIRDMDPEEKKTAAGVTAINKVLDSMAEMEGLKVGKIEVTGKDGNALIPPSRFDHLTTEQIEKLLEHRGP